MPGGQQASYMKDPKDCAATEKTESNDAEENTWKRQVRRAQTNNGDRNDKNDTRHGAQKHC